MSSFCIAFILCIFLYFSITDSASLNLTQITESRRHNETEKFPTVSSIINGRPSGKRPFYVQIRTMGNFRTCGGAIIGSSWVLTAATCVHDVDARFVFVETSDFSSESSRISEYRVVKKFIEPGFSSGEEPFHNLAILKTAKRIGKGNVIYICEQDRTVDTLLGTCGMGEVARRTQSGFNKVFPPVLMETRLFRAYINANGIYSADRCITENICTYSLDEQHYPGKLVDKDMGGPLYSFHCGTFIPECLYGIASYRIECGSCDRECQKRSNVFVSLPVYYSWIYKILLEDIEADIRIETPF